jgi:hypothetical protein
MSAQRFIEFLQTSGRLGAGSFSFAAALYCISFYEHFADHNVRASVLAMSAVVCFCIGAYAAWSNERKQSEELQSKAARPQIAFSATAEPEPRWFQFKESSVPPLFELTHLGGEAAQFIQIEPLISMHSKTVRLEFDQIRFLDAGKEASLQVSDSFSTDRRLTQQTRYTTLELCRSKLMQPTTVISTPWSIPSE